jgi:hypothetical protein
VLWALVKKVTLWAMDWLLGADRRRRKARLRAAKNKLMRERANVRKLMRQRTEQRLRNEQLRRRALLRYREAQLEIVIECLDVLEAAKKAAYTRIKTIEDRLNDREHRAFISPAIFRDFLDRKMVIHTEIAASKVLTQSLHSEKHRLTREIHELRDSTTYRRLGAKTKIEALLSELQFAARAELAPATEIELEYLRIELDERCPTCRAGLGTAFAWCPLCGQSREGPERQRFFKKDAGPGVLTCPKCLAPAHEGFSYCFNCGYALDPFGLKQALSA